MNYENYKKLNEVLCFLRKERGMSGQEIEILLRQHVQEYSKKFNERGVVDWSRKVGEGILKERR